MKLKHIFVFAMLMSISFAQVKKWTPDEAWLQKGRLTQRPLRGCVPDKETALIIGKAVLGATFGKRFIQNSGPYDAKLFGDVWVVFSYYEPYDERGGPNLGGVTTVELSKTNGAVLGISTER